MADHAVIIVGAGALGAATAWYAAELTGGDVLLVDRGEVAGGTTGRGAGLVNRLLSDPLDIGLVDASLPAFRSLPAGSGGRYHAPGGLLLAERRHDPALARLLRVWAAQGLEVLRLEPEEVAEIPGTPALDLSPEEAAFLVEGDGWADTTAMTRAMVAHAQAAGAELATGTEVSQVDDGAIRIAGGDRLTAEAIVVAAGAWSGEVLAGFGHAPLLAYRPQAAELAVEHPGGLPIVHDLVHHTYWRGAGPGTVIIGDGTVLEPQASEGEPPVEPSFTEEVRAKLAARWPRAEAARLVRAWAGFEAGTPDQRPLAGRVPGAEATFVLTGGNGFGFMRSPALGEAVARMAVGLAPSQPLGALDPGRFSWETPASFDLREGFSLTP
ncbi:MAG: FAD-binding oxidoreductase [Candidatus Thermoplasmatota archaeon]|nr:FAD-binding oxidoreductase [Candidatus Thermoplasmatota archaeon]